MGKVQASSGRVEQDEVVAALESVLKQMVTQGEYEID